MTRGRQCIHAHARARGLKARGARAWQSPLPQQPQTTGTPSLLAFPPISPQVQALLGGRLKVMISGSAPLSADTQKFIQTVFNCPLRQGCVCVGCALWCWLCCSLCAVPCACSGVIRVPAACLIRYAVSAACENGSASPLQITFVPRSRPPSDSCNDHEINQYSIIIQSLCNHWIISRQVRPHRDVLRRHHRRLRRQHPERGLVRNHSIETLAPGLG